MIGDSFGTVEVESGSEVAGKYRVLERLGGGRLGSVYKVEHAPLEGVITIYQKNSPALGEISAMRILRSAVGSPVDNVFLSQFFRQMATLSTVGDSRVVAAFDYGVWQDSAYLVMPFISGNTLDRVIEQGGLVDSFLVELISQLAATVSSAHRRQLFHLNLNPNNIVVEVSTESSILVKVLDFGLVSLYGQASLDLYRESPGAIPYSLRFQAPEYYLGYDIDQRADVYSLGAILCELLTRSSSKDADFLTESVQAYLEAGKLAKPDIELKLDFCEELKPIIHRALEPQAYRRQSSADEFWVEVEKVFAGKSHTVVLPQTDRSLDPENVATKAVVNYRPPWYSVRPGFGKLLALAVLFWFGESYILPAILDRIAASEAFFDSADLVGLHQNVVTLQSLWKRLGEQRRDAVVALKTAEGRNRSAREALVEEGKESAVVKKQAASADRLFENVRERNTQLDEEVFNNPEMLPKLTRKQRALSGVLREKGVGEANELALEVSAGLTHLLDKAERINALFVVRERAVLAESSWQSTLEENQISQPDIEEKGSRTMETAELVRGGGDFVLADDYYRQIAELYIKAEYAAREQALSRSEKIEAEQPEQVKEQGEDRSEQLMSQAEQVSVASSESSSTPIPTQAPKVISVEDSRAIERGMILWRSGFYAKAAVELENGLKSGSENADVRNALGNCYYNMRRFEEAVRELNAALSLRADFAEARYNLANTYYNLDRLDAAVAEYQEVIRLQPADARAYGNLGGIYEKMGKDEEAAASFAKALELDPGNKVVKKALDSLGEKK